MKKTFFSLRKMGFVLLAASSMLVLSCGGEEALEDAVTDAATDAIENATETVEEVVEEVVEEHTCEGGDMEETDSTAHACDEGACDEGACGGGESHDH